MEDLNVRLQQTWDIVVGWIFSVTFYAQVSFALAAIALAYLVATGIRARVRMFRDTPEQGPIYDIRLALYKAGELVFPVFNIVFLGVAIQISEDVVQQGWVPRLAQGWAVIFLLYQIISTFVTSSTIKLIVTWIGVPLAVLYVVGWLDDVTLYLDGVAFHAGDIRISALALGRTLLFGFILFWLGRISNDTGKRVIRNNEKMDVGTREVLAKLFEISLFAIIFLMLLQVVGINLTALTVFGGALGVGLGFGLQQIAANFVSGIIILLDRSITIGDYIQLEDGRGGTIRELSMRSAILETYDGKDIMVPNESFITTSFTNWTHFNQKQRYPIEFSVAYKTDLPKMFDILREVVASHPRVLSGDDVPIEERPDAEIASFGDSGINILVEFWMEGVDDGPNRVGADLLLMIWMALKENDIEIPFPQREIKVLSDDKKPLA
ncbi:MAG: mechanosensitive ion channel [Rhodospirillaceae bacterium]